MNEPFGKITREQFEDSIVGQDDDNDYQESGYVACVINDIAAIAGYWHCSCYDTFAALVAGDYDYPEEGIPQFEWSGTVEELVSMAEFTSDIHMPDRKANTDDHDYDHLVNMYKEVLQWYSNRGDYGT